MKIFLISLLLLSSVAQADISKDMKMTAESLSKLLLLSSQLKVFEKNKNEVQGLFEKLNESLSKNHQHFKGKSPHFEMNQKILQRLNLQALKAYKARRYEVSRQHLLAEPGVCLSCHQNDKTNSLSFLNKIPDSLSLSEKAQFAMATRQPEQAINLFDKALNQQMKNEQKEEILRKKLNLLISYLPTSETNSVMQKTLKDISPKSSLHSLVKGWVSGIEKSQKIFSTPLKDINGVLKAIKAQFSTEEPVIGLLASPEDEVFFLYLKKNLLELMPSLSNEELPQAYFWMAQSERAVGYELYYSLADSYLVTCIENWPKLPIAKKCYSEYESFMEFAYSGSSGTHIPEDVKAELKQLKSQLAQ